MKLGLVFLTAIVVVSCQESVTTPPQGPGTEFPCGYRGVDCGDETCCYEGDVCGGAPFTGCPADTCCFTGEDAVGSKKPYPKVRRRHTQ
jgi:hypothetical protein